MDRDPKLPALPIGIPLTCSTPSDDRVLRAPVASPAIFSPAAEGRVLDEAADEAIVDVEVRTVRRRASGSSLFRSPCHPLKLFAPMAAAANLEVGAWPSVGQRQNKT